MPELLEDIADNDAAVLGAWATAYNDRSPQLHALPKAERARELLTLAREFTRRASWAVETAEGWLEEFQARLCIGMGGHKVRALLQSGQTLCGMCRSVVEIAGDLWKLCGEPAGESLDAITQRLARVEVEIEKIAKVARTPTPEVIDNLFQKAEEQGRQGKGLTREQSLAAIRKTV